MTKAYSKETNFYRSSDLALVSALNCYGYQVEAINKQNPSKAIFLIKQDKQLDSLVQQYFTHQLKVDPLSFFNYLKEIKTRC